MYEHFTILFAGFFKKAEAEGRDPFWILGSSVAMELLNDCYRQFMKDGITPLESLPAETKQRYWNKSKEHYQETEQRIKACRVAYVLELITEKI